MKTTQQKRNQLRDEVKAEVELIRVGKVRDGAPSGPPDYISINAEVVLNLLDDLDELVRDSIRYFHKGKK